MNLPLQPDLQPSPMWWRRWLAAGALLLAVLALGLVAPTARHAPRLLVTDARSEDDYLHNLLRAIDAARERVWVLVYVVHPDRGQGPVTRLAEALGKAVERGVDVRVVLDLDREWDSQAIDDKHVRARALFQQHGVPVWLDSLERRTHAKTVLVDHDLVIVGSHNWTTSALRWNRELSVLHRDQAMAERLADICIAVFAEGQRH